MMSYEKFMKRFNKRLFNLQKKKKMKYNDESNWEKEAERLEITVDYYIAEFL